MKKIIVSMLDRKSDFGECGCVDNEELAKRQFGYALSQNGIPNYAPADFELYKIGEFDTKNGQITSLDKPELLCTGLDMIGR